MDDYCQITKKELSQWFTQWIQYKNGYHMEPMDKQELLNLNSRVMEVANKIHNDSMMDKEW